jgi:hypothetical protein
LLPHFTLDQIRGRLGMPSTPTTTPGAGGALEPEFRKAMKYQPPESGGMPAGASLLKASYQEGAFNTPRSDAERMLPQAVEKGTYDGLTDFFARGQSPEGGGGGAGGAGSAWPRSAPRTRPPAAVV